MNRAEAMEWMHERFSEDLIQRDPEWVETMIEILGQRERVGEGR